MLSAGAPRVLAPVSPQVQLNESTKRVLSICNNGKFGFSFSWELSGPAARVQLLTLAPQTGSVQAESKVETQLVFHPQKMCSLKDVELTLQVRHPCLVQDLRLPHAPAGAMTPKNLSLTAHLLLSFGTWFSLLSPRVLPQPPPVFVVAVPIPSAGSHSLSAPQISQGPTFTCVFLATVVVPAIHFSATRLNFGACFVYQAGMPPARQTLIITNKADKDVR